MDGFWVSLVTVFCLEMGDKTQLVALSLAARYNAWVTLAGIFAATLVVHVFSVALGWGSGFLFPAEWIGFVAGLAFIAFGMWTLRGDCLEEDDVRKCRTCNPFWLVFITFFLAELGDKTMLGTVNLALEHRKAIIPVWIGSSLGMVVSDGIAIVVGQVVGARLPERIIQICASCIFLGFGLFKSISEGMKLPIFAWAIAGAVLIILAYIFFRPTQKKVCLTPEAAAELMLEESDCKL